jgi:hypothetical protein
MVESTVLVAVIVTVEDVFMVAGAVTEAVLPLVVTHVQAGLTFQATEGFVLLLSLAAILTPWPA